MKAWQRPQGSVDIGYIRLRKAGPTMQEQGAKLVSVGVPVSGKDERVFIDEASKPRQKATDDPLPERAKAIRCCRSGDRLVVDSATTLGISTDDILFALAQIGKRGAYVYDVTANEIIFIDDIPTVIGFAQRGGAEGRMEKARKMRKSAIEQGKFGFATKIRAPSKVALAKEMWPNSLYSAKEVSEASGIAVRSLYRMFGNRGTALFGRNPNK